MWTAGEHRSWRSDPARFCAGSGAGHHRRIAACGDGLAVATEAADWAGYDGFAPDACLINRYEPCGEALEVKGV
jgi:hypothetical protein